MLKEKQICLLEIRKKSEPFSFVGVPKLKPFMELVFGNIEPLTQLFNGKKTKKVFAKNPENKKKSVSSVRNDDVRKNSVSMIAAGTFNPHNAETVGMRMTVKEVSNASAIVGVKYAVTGALTAWAGFE